MSDLIKLKNGERKNKCLSRFLIDLFSVRWPRLQSRVLHQSCDFLRSDVSVCVRACVSAVAILDCSLNVYACGRQKALAMPAYCVAANCNNSQATQNITMHEFPRNRPAVRRNWVKLVHFKRADFDAAPHHAHLCSDHLAECDFANFIEYRISKRNLKPTAFPSVQKKHQSRLQNT